MYPNHDYIVWQGLVGGYLDFDSLQTNSSLAFEADTMLVAASVPYGKGEVIFVTSPLLLPIMECWRETRRSISSA